MYYYLVVFYNYLGLALDKTSDLVGGRPTGTASLKVRQNARDSRDRQRSGLVSVMNWKDDYW